MYFRENLFYNTYKNVLILSWSKVIYNFRYLNWIYFGIYILIYENLVKDQWKCFISNFLINFFFNSVFFGFWEKLQHKLSKQLSAFKGHYQRYFVGKHITLLHVSMNVKSLQGKSAKFTFWENKNFEWAIFTPKFKYLCEVHESNI